MKKLLVLLLSLALLPALVSCGRKGSTLNDYDTPTPPQQETGQTQSGESTPAPNPDPGPDSVPDNGMPLLPDPESTGSDLADLGEGADNPRTIQASHSDVTLKYAGDTFQLSVLGVEGIYASTFTSDAPEVASVDGLTGSVTAVSPGAATVSMHVECSSGQYDFDCIVRCVWTEEASGEDILASLPERFDFSSGAGAWGTEVSIAADGTFTGLYHDSNAGEGGEGYVSTIYSCQFSGKFSAPVQVDTYTYSMTLKSLELTEEPGQESIDADGIRWVTSTPYGLEDAGEILIFLPGAKVTDLPEDFISWTHSRIEDSETLPFCGLYNVNEGLGFAGVG